MFDALRIHGTAGAILNGYFEAAVFRSWSIAKVNGQWTLTGYPMRIEAFPLNHSKRLLFTAPREETRDGFWAWGVEKVDVGTAHLVVAILGPPEQ